MKEREEECSTERAEGSTSVVGDGVCKAKGVVWEMGCVRCRCRVQDRDEASSERGPSLPGPPTVYYILNSRHGVPLITSPL